jgi:hypothetical protein
MELNYPKVEPGEITLGEAEHFIGTGLRSVKTFTGFNCGSKTFSLVMSLFDLQHYTQVDREAQRPLDPKHAQSIAQYILKGLLHGASRTRQNGDGKIPQAMSEIIANMEMGAYMSIPPLVTSFRDCKPDGTDIKAIPLRAAENGELASYRITLHDNTRFWVVDGQHRREALRLVQQFLDDIRSYRRYPSQPKLYPAATRGILGNEELQVWHDALTEMHKCMVTMEVHLGLSPRQEKQLFHDLNNLGMAVKKNLARDFDDSNPINHFTKQSLRETKLSGRVLMQDKVSWEDQGFSFADLVAVNSLLLTNKTSEKGARAAEVSPRIDGANRFWDSVIKAGDLRSENARQRTVLAQPVVMKALGKLWYDFNWGKKANLTTAENQHKLEAGIGQLNFGHDNKMWQYYLMNEADREAQFPGLNSYLPGEGKGTKDVGTFDGNVFKFGIKHNDIYPIIGDMIRWQLKLPSRHSE